MNDQSIRLGVVLFVVGVALVIALGGLLTSVAGAWRDGDRIIQLRQFGPWVWGRCERPRGHEVYRGWALYGVVRLERSAFGKGFLFDSGFAPQHQPLVEGQVQARFFFRLKDEALVGMFQGRRFTFVDRPRPRVDSVTFVADAPRAWYREVG